MVQVSNRLEGRRILVVEDEYFVAAELDKALRGAAAFVVGPFARLDKVCERIDAGELDASVLDINISNEQSYPVAERLSEQRVPFLFVTGYDDWHLPEQFRHAPRLTKPANSQSMIVMLSAMIGSRSC